MFCNSPSQKGAAQAPRKSIAHVPQIYGLYFYLTVVVTITHHLGLDKEENSHCHRVLQPKPFADPILTSPRGRAISAPHFCLLSIWRETLLVHIQVWLILTETAGRELHD